MRDFPCHKIKVNHSTGIPTRCFYLDTETKFEEDLLGTQRHKFDLGWTCFSRLQTDNTWKDIWNYWLSSVRLFDFLSAKAIKDHPLYVFGHNVYFDLQAAAGFRYFTQAGWELNFVYDEGLTFILVIEKDKRLIRFLSTTNFWETSLKILGQTIGLEKLEIDFAAADQETKSVYCHRDVEIIKLAMEKYFALLQANDLGKFRLTRGSQAMGCYRHRFMTTGIYIHKEPDIVELERASYYGGRVECFQLGQVSRPPFVSLDINSMYPYIMANWKLPCQLVDFYDEIDPEDLTDILSDNCVVGQVTVKTDFPWYAVKAKHKLIFPVGTFKTYLCTAGIKKALEKNHLVKIHKLAVYKAGYLFTDFVDYFYNLRKQCKANGDAVGNNFYWKFLNSLYGKFSQKVAVYNRSVDYDSQDYYKEEIYDLVTGKRETEYRLLNTVLTQIGDEESNITMISICSHITEIGRLLLTELIEKVDCSRVLYCDTDSLIIRLEDLKKLDPFIDPVKLGKLKIEGEFTSLEIFAPKAYVTNTKTRLKGIPYGAVKLGPKTYRYISFPGLDTHLRLGINDYHIVKPVVKVLKLLYDKGKVLPDGRVVPFTIVEP